MADSEHVSTTEGVLGALVTLVMVAVPALILRWAWRRITQ